MHQLTHCKIIIIVTCDKIFSIFSIFKRDVPRKTKSVACKNIFIDLRCSSNDNKHIMSKMDMTNLKTMFYEYEEEKEQYF